MLPKSGIDSKGSPAVELYHQSNQVIFRDSKHIFIKKVIDEVKKAYGRIIDA